MLYSKEEVELSLHLNSQKREKTLLAEDLAYFKQIMTEEPGDEAPITERSPSPPEGCEE